MGVNAVGKVEITGREGKNPKTCSLDAVRKRRQPPRGENTGKSSPEERLKEKGPSIQCGGGVLKKLQSAVTSNESYAPSGRRQKGKRVVP